MSLRPTEYGGKVRWTWPIGTFFGVPTRVHLSMALLAAYAAFEGMTAFSNPWLGAALSLAGLVIVFTSVLLHEFGHVLMARRFGIKTRSVTLSPLGGIAQLERLPERPQEELRVALAGPAVNVALALAAVAISLAFGGAGVAPGPAGVLLDLTLWANVTLAVFNRGQGDAYSIVVNDDNWKKEKFRIVAGANNFTLDYLNHGDQYVHE